MKNFKILAVSLILLALLPFTGLGEVVVEPDIMAAVYANSIYEMPGTIYLGNISETYSVYDIDVTALLINGNLVPLVTTVINDYTEIEGDVLKIDFDMVPFVGGYVPLWDSTLQIFSVTGVYGDATEFLFEGEVIMLGHRSGDANSDGIVNIFDISYLVAFLYLNGPAPRLVEAVDFDGNGSIELVDALYLMDYIYFDGPPPVGH